MHMFEQPVKINIRQDQVFEFGSKVKRIMYDILHEESFRIASANMIHYIATEGVTGPYYKDNIMAGIHNRQNRVNDFLFLHLDIIKFFSETEYFIGNAVGTDKDKTLYKKLLELPEVQDFSELPEIPDSHLYKNGKGEEYEWSLNMELLNHSVRYAIPYQESFIPFYVMNAYDSSDWKRFWKEAFNHERIFKAAAHQAIEEYFIKNPNHVPTREWYGVTHPVVYSNIDKLYKEHPEYVEIPDYTLEEDSKLPGFEYKMGMWGKKIFPDIKKNIPDEWIKDTLTDWEHYKTYLWW